MPVETGTVLCTHTNIRLLSLRSSAARGITSRTGQLELSCMTAIQLNATVFGTSQYILAKTI